MAGHRQDKLTNAGCLELAAILREVKDPRVSGAFISIVGANVAPDMSMAQIFYVYGLLLKIIAMTFLFPKTF